MVSFKSIPDHILNEFKAEVGNLRAVYGPRDQKNQLQ